MVDKIVTLNDGSEYCITNETFYANKKYCVGVKYFEDKQDVENQYYVFEENFDGDRVSLQLVDDKELKDYIFLKISSENDEKSVIFNNFIEITHRPHG